MGFVVIVGPAMSGEEALEELKKAKKLKKDLEVDIEKLHELAKKTRRERFKILIEKIKDFDSAINLGSFESKENEEFVILLKIVLYEYSLISETLRSHIEDLDAPSFEDLPFHFMKHS